MKNPSVEAGVWIGFADDKTHDHIKEFYHMNGNEHQEFFSFLAESRKSIPYLKILNPLTGGVTGSILMQQLEYWFQKKPNGFYKFLDEAPNNRFYKPGDSWKEELGFGLDEFRGAFDKIGVRYTSKTQYQAAAEKGDPFKGLFYCSYHDKQKGLTIYLRNHPQTNESLKRLLNSEFTVDRDPQFTVNGKIQFTGDGETQFTVTREIPSPLYTENTYQRLHTDQIKDPCKSPSGTERVLAERVVTRMPVAVATSSAVADTPNLELELVFEKESSEGEMGVKVARKARPKKDKRQKLTTSEYQRFQDTYNNHKPQSFARMVVVNAVREDVIDKLVQDFGGVEEALNVLEKAMKQACQEQWCRGLVLSFENFASNNKFLTHYEGWLAVNQKDTPAPSPQNLDPWTMLPIPLRRAYMPLDKLSGVTEEDFNRNQREQQVIWFAENGFPELSQKLALKLP